MKTKFSVMMALLLSAALFTNAQQRGYPRLTTAQRVTNVMTKLTGPLQLDTVQQQKTAGVFTDFFDAQTKLRQDAMASGQRPDRSLFQKLIADRDAKLKDIFNADQFKKYTDEVEPGLRPGRPGGYGGPQRSN